MDALTLRDWLSIVVIPLTLAVLRNVNQARGELVRVRERLTAVETEVKIRFRSPDSRSRREDE